MPHPTLIPGAAGGEQGSTGRVIAALLLEQGIPVRAVTGRNPQTPEEFFRANAGSFGTGATSSKTM
jgi:hypothetical protein